MGFSVSDVLNATLTASLLYTAVGGNFSAHLHPELKLPLCTSLDQVCDVALKISPVDGTSEYHSDQTICQCPGGIECPRGWFADPNRTLYQSVYSTGQKVEMKLSYCTSKATPEKECSENEVSIALRGTGPIAYEVIGDVQCKCSHPLELHSAKPNGIFVDREYACNKPFCDVKATKKPVCEKVTSKTSFFGHRMQSYIPCICPTGTTCWVEGSKLPQANGKSTQFYCEFLPV